VHKTRYYYYALPLATITIKFQKSTPPQFIFLNQPAD